MKIIIGMLSVIAILSIIPSISAEELELLDALSDSELEILGGRHGVEDFMVKAAKAVSDFYIEHTPSDGIPYWDTGAPGLHNLGDYLSNPANPFNNYTTQSSRFLLLQPSPSLKPASTS